MDSKHEAGREAGHTARRQPASGGGQLTQILMRQIHTLQESLSDAARTGQALRELCDRLAGADGVAMAEPEAEPDAVAGWRRMNLPRPPAGAAAPLTPSNGLGRLSDRGAGDVVLVALRSLDAAGTAKAVAAWRRHAFRSGERAVFLVAGGATAPLVAQRLPFEHLPPVSPEDPAAWQRLAERRLRIVLARWQPAAILLAGEGRPDWLGRLLDRARAA